MRLDSFLSDVRLIKRRTQAKKACENQIVWVDGTIAKPSKEVKVGQRILVDFTSRTIEIEVLDIPKRNVKKEEAHKFFKLLKEERKKNEFL
ncbi:MAG: S4 domain-containing protein [Candidatus Zixiibacteriota bacterium]